MNSTESRRVVMVNGVNNEMQRFFFLTERPGPDRDRKFLPCPRGLLLRVLGGFKEGRWVEHVHVQTHILDRE